MSDENTPPNAEPVSPLSKAAQLRARFGPKGLRVALAVSVALNLAVLGLGIGAAFHMKGDGPREQVRSDLGFGPMAEALRPEDRRALRQGLIGRAPALRDAANQRRADMAALLEALRSDPLDRGALSAAVGNMRLRLEGQLALGHEALEELLVQMPSTERAAFADRLERGLRRGGKDRKSDGN